MTESQPAPKQWWQLPFDLYDFFGYLFPGVVFVLSLGTLVTRTPGVDSAPALIRSVTAVIQSPLQWWGGLLIILAAIVVLYSVGHVIASVSAIVLDRIFLTGVFGHPYKRLLRLNDPVDKVGRACYEYLFLFATIWLICVLIGGALSPSPRETAVFAGLCVLVSLPKLRRPNRLLKNPS